MADIIVEVAGGVVQDITNTTTETLVIIDYDNISGDGPLEASCCQLPTAAERLAHVREQHPEAII